ncbi:hypothetical protein F5Y13DRAFT_190701 [Hypoxylon sp. FL1857]|nr:hypothetical protein F5Y13DRAFT_190701 [Hypoxylon sp. FL1857]
MSSASSKNRIDIFKSCANFSELPDDDNPWSECKISLKQTEPSKNSLSKRDIEMRKYEEYLRLKWGGAEAMPEDFDPDKLEDVFQARMKYREERKDAVRIATECLSGGKVSELDTSNTLAQAQEYGSIDSHPAEAKASSESLFKRVSVTESLDTDEQLEGYESEATINAASTAIISRVTGTPDSFTTVIHCPIESPTERAPTPRIRSGSKPPLSRSAFSLDGLPIPSDGHPRKRPSDTLRDYPRAPQYFPFTSTAIKDE